MFCSDNVKKNMAGFTWIFFGVFIVCCQAHFGYDHSNDNSQSNFKNPQTPLIRPLNSGITDQRCFTLARRPFYMTRLMQYPCSKQMNGVPVFRSYMSPMGPMCMSYMREPVHKYYRIPVCCPGYAMDNEGKCSIRVADMQPSEQQRPNFQNMMAMAATMRRSMLLKAKQAMEKKRQDLLNRMQQSGPMMPPRRPPLSPLFKMLALRKLQQQQSPPKVTFIRFKRPSTLPMPHPLQRPPLSGGMIKLITKQMFPQRSTPFTPTARFPFMQRPFPQIQRPFEGMSRRTMGMPRSFTGMPRSFDGVQDRQPPTPRFVLSGRSPMSSFNQMREFHPPPTPPMPRMPGIQVPQMPTMPTRIPQEFQRQNNFPQIPENNVNGYDTNSPRQFPDMHSHSHHHSHSHMHSHEGQDSNMTPESMQIDLPNMPLEMSEPTVEQTPNAYAAMQDSCIAMMETGVKYCLQKYSIDIANGPLMTAFEPINDDMSRVLCDTEETIFQCISDSLKDCNDKEGAAVARNMLMETAETVKAMCNMREESVLAEQTTEQPFPEEPFQVSVEQNLQSVPPKDSVSAQTTVENVDDIPTDVKPAPAETNEILTAVKDNTPLEEMPKEMQQAIKTEVHVEELRMKEYYLPILVGSGVGFMILVLFISLLICCCCKRKLRKKMRMSKEWEKPPLKEGIYTIGVPPHMYEVNGIPPMYYEEAKGEKISCKSPAVLQGSDDESLDGEHM